MSDNSVAGVILFAFISFIIGLGFLISGSKYSLDLLGFIIVAAIGYIIAEYYYIKSFTKKSTERSDFILFTGKNIGIVAGVVAGACVFNSIWVFFSFIFENVKFDDFINCILALLKPTAIIIGIIVLFVSLKWFIWKRFVEK